MVFRNGWQWVVVSALTGAVTMSLTLLAFASMRASDREAVRAEFRGQAEKQAVVIDQELQRQVERIQSLADVIRLYPEPPADQFGRYADLVLNRRPALFSLAWAEWVPGERRAAVVEAIRADGYDVADLLTRGADGRPVRAPDRDHHLVVRHVAPEAFEDVVVGFDLMSLANRREVVERAMRTGQAAATRPIPLAGERDRPPGVVLLVPIYATLRVPEAEDDRAAQFRGAFAVGFRVDRTLDRWLTETIPWPGLPMSVRVISPFRTVVHDTGRVLFDSHTASATNRTPTHLDALSNHALAVAVPVDVGGRPWTVLITPAEGFEAAWTRARAPWVALALGSVVSVLLTITAGMYLRHYARARAFAEERAATAAQLTGINERLRETNEEMERFVSAVSHDLKNPVVGMEWLCRSVRPAAERGDTAAMLRAVEGFEQGARSMRRLIDDLLELSRAGHAPFRDEAVDTDALVRGVLANHAAELQRRGMHARIDTPLPTLRADRARLSAAFDNLVANAWKYGISKDADHQAELRIGCETTPASDAAPGFVRFYVRDNGPGVPEDAAERIFLSFQRVATDEEGTGLGLAIVERAAKAHGGGARVEPTPGGGATFWLEIPVRGEPPADPAPGPAAPPAPAAADG